MLFQYNNEPYYKPERSYMSKTVSKYLESYGGKDKKRGCSYNARRVGDGKGKKKKIYCCNNKMQCNENESMEELYYVSENERLQKEIAEYQRKIAIVDKQIQMLEEWKRGLIKEKVYAYVYEYESEQHNFSGVKHNNNNNNSNSNSHVNTIQTLSMTCTDTNND